MAVRRAKPPSARALRQAEEAEKDLFHRLREQGAAEMRRRFSHAVGAGRLFKEPSRRYFIEELEETARMATQSEQRRIRENYGEREAHFRQGLAQEATSMLRGMAYWPREHKTITEEELRQGREEATAWARGRR
jgi:hypothetical protein